MSIGMTQFASFWRVLGCVLILGLVGACGSETEQVGEPSRSGTEAISSSIAAAEARNLVAVVLDTDLPPGSEPRLRAGEDLAKLGRDAWTAIDAGLERIPQVEQAVRAAGALPGSEALDVEGQLAALQEARRILADLVAARPRTSG